MIGKSKEIQQTGKSKKLTANANANEIINLIDLEEVENEVQHQSSQQ